MFVVSDNNYKPDKYPLRLRNASSRLSNPPTEPVGHDLLMNHITYDVAAKAIQYVLRLFIFYNYNMYIVTQAKPRLAESSIRLLEKRARSIRKILTRLATVPSSTIIEQHK